MGIAALSTESFGAAVRHMARYKKLSAPEEILTEINAHEWIIQSLVAGDRGRTSSADWTLFCLRTHDRTQGTGTAISPVRVDLVHARSHVKELQRHFGCPIVCGATRNAMVFRATDAQLPFVTRNAELLDMLAPQFELKLKERTPPNEDSFLEMVRGAIQQRLTGHRPGIEDVARDLHMSARSLQRKLQENGATFQRLLDDARHEMARYYLTNSVLELLRPGVSQERRCAAEALARGASQRSRPLIAQRL
jgi:transcriptional regulator GlxA family with amidase domain